MKVEFLIPASPTPGFFSQVSMFCLALDRLGDFYSEARVVCVFGDKVKKPVPARWAHWLERVEIHWVPPADFNRCGYLAQGYRRFELLDPTADLSVICDADIMPIRRFGSEFKSLIAERAIGGVIAHSHFPWTKRSGTGGDDWEMLSRRLLGRPVETPFCYTLSDTAAWGCPFYINFGFLAGPPQVLSRVFREVKLLRGPVHEIINNYFEAQIAFALAASASDVAVRALPMRYNFPNDSKADAMYPNELEAVSVIHYLRLKNFDRQNIFCSAELFENFLSLDLKGSNGILQETVREITGGVYPFRDFLR